MKIKVLSTRGEIEKSAPYHSKQSGVLIDNIILLDCGEKQFLNYNPQYILITHLHLHHAYFVRYNETPNTDVPIYAPEQYDKGNIRVAKKSFKIDDYKITSIPIIHSITVKSTVYLIEHKKSDYFILALWA